MDRPVQQGNPRLTAGATGPRLGGGEWRLALPLALFFLAFFLAPLVLLVSVSFYDDPRMTTVGIGQYEAFFGDMLNLEVLWETLLLGVKATLLCLVAGYPVAWLCARSSGRMQGVLLFVIILPILTSVVVRTFAWVVILGREGLINQAIVGLGLSAEPIRLLFSELGVVIVLAQVQMPLMVLPLLTTLQRIDPNLADASAALGAGAWRTFFKVTLPLSLPGILAGSILVYAACVTAFVTHTLIGGVRLLYMPLFIFQQAMDLQNWPFAAAISVMFMISVLLVIALLVTLSRSSRSQIYG
jgi:putative spermidine/putrescine transport system permease protein